MTSMGEIKNKCGGCGQEKTLLNCFTLAAVKFKQENLELVAIDGKRMFLCDECFSQRLGDICGEMATTETT